MASEASSLYLWNLLPTFSVIQATLLFCGADPSDIESEVERSPNHRPHGYVPVKNAIVNALSSELIRGDIRHQSDETGFTGEIDLYETKISRGELDRFFRISGISGSFFGQAETGSAISSSLGPMPAKLAAANAAWEAFSANPALVSRYSPKETIKRWLTDRAQELGLVNKEGRPNASGIEEVAKVANWKPTGGATPTPEARAQMDFIPGISDRVEQELDEWDGSPF